MNKITFILVGAFILNLNVSTAFAESLLNCSNAEGTLKRVEKEIWDSPNYISWKVDGRKIQFQKEEFDDASKVVLLMKKTTELPGTVEEVFVSGVSIYLVPKANERRRPISDFVICRRTSNSRQD